ncbi:MAG: hypothetical protein ACT4QE_09495 [Anaerolineales bacterium]
MVFTLLLCPRCKIRYAAVPHPERPTNWIFFDAAYCDVEHPSHICSGGMLCVLGHKLDLISSVAVMTAGGAWLHLDSPMVPVVVN